MNPLSGPYSRDDAFEHLSIDLQATCDGQTQCSMPNRCYPDTFWYACVDPTYRPLDANDQRATKEQYIFTGIPASRQDPIPPVDCGAGKIAKLVEADYGAFISSTGGR